MIKISDAIYDIIRENPALSYAFHHRLLNLSQLARFIRSSVATRTKKETTFQAVLMNLSRLQNKIAGIDPATTKALFLDQIAVHSGLSTFTVFKTDRVYQEINNLFGKVREDGGFITITEGISEVTTIIGDEHFKAARQTIGQRPTHIHRNIASVGVKFEKKLLEIPGILYQLLQQVTMQNVNIIEVVSTATEFNIYVAQSDVEVAFESIFRRFSRTDRGREAV